jgi:hypothetical protein
MRRRYMVMVSMIGFLASCAPAHLQDLESLHRERDDIRLTLSTLPIRPHVGKNLFRANLTDASEKPITDAVVTFYYRMGQMSFLMPHAVKGDMPHPGLYEAEADLNMGGDWDVTVEVERAGFPTIREEFVISAGSM